MLLDRITRPRSWFGPAAARLPLALACALLCMTSLAPAQTGQPLIFHVDAASQKLEMTVNASRILTTKKKVPQVQVNNPELLELTPLSATQVQVHAKKAGVTQINLWDENNQIKTVDVIVFGDAQELNMVLRTTFPRSTLRVIPLANSAIISGYVDRPDDVERIVRIAEDFYPKIINAITVGGVQQVLLEVKVMEVSRTRLRNLGFDWADFAAGFNGVQTVGGLLTSASATSGITTSGTETFAFSIVDSGNSFFGVVEALRQNDLAKVLAEPKLMTISGRPAYFQAGGEFPILVPQSLGTVSVQYRRFGTEVDFVPIVLGNGLIRLEVRPRVSEIDTSRSVTIGGNTIPGLRTRQIDTGCELRAGQTLALAGLVQSRTESQTRGIPWLMDIPVVKLAFSRIHEQTNEIELLILVTPHLVDAMDCHEVPQCGPGTMTDSPSDCEMFLHNYIEVPRCCPPRAGDPESMQSYSNSSGGMMVLPPGATHGGDANNYGVEAMPLPPAEDVAPPPAPAIRNDSTRSRRPAQSKPTPQAASQRRKASGMAPLFGTKQPLSAKPAPRVTADRSVPAHTDKPTKPIMPARSSLMEREPAREPVQLIPPTGMVRTQASDVRQTRPLQLRPAVSGSSAKPGFLGSTGYDSEK
ncbi:MAG: pilus assembly protein N-terminal domain-containing protein [Pirellulales bacterium]